MAFSQRLGLVLLGLKSASMCEIAPRSMSFWLGVGRRQEDSLCESLGGVIMIPKQLVHSGLFLGWGWAPKTAGSVAYLVHVTALCSHPPAFGLALGADY